MYSNEMDTNGTSGIHYIGGVNNPDSFLTRLFDYLTDGQLQWEDMGEGL